MKKYLFLVFAMMILLMPAKVYAKDDYLAAKEKYYELFDELHQMDTDGYQEWYYEYEKYANIYDHERDTVDTFFSEEEVNLMLRVVETETYQASFYQKVNVANVLINRFSSMDFNYLSMEEVVVSENQFAFHRTKISEDTIDALNFAFEVMDTTDGCVAFRSDKKVEKFHKWDYGFYDGVHWFYKSNEEEG